MGKSLNTQQLSGHLAQDPKIFVNDDGTSSAILRVAVNGSKKDQSGEWVDDPIFVDVKIWGRQVDSVETYLTKGSFVMVEGRMSHPRIWTPEGGDPRATPVVIARSVVFGPRTDGAVEPPAPRQQAARQSAPSRQAAPISAADFGDNLPF